GILYVGWPTGDTVHPIAGSWPLRRYTVCDCGKRDTPDAAPAAWQTKGSSQPGSTARHCVACHVADWRSGRLGAELELVRRHTGSLTAYRSCHVVGQHRQYALGRAILQYLAGLVEYRDL